MTVYVLTRTACRPKMFARLRESVLSQECEHKIIHVVHIEVDAGDYAEGDIVVRGRRIPKGPGMSAPWELYNERMLSVVSKVARKDRPGWVMFIDDDDVFTSETAVARAFANADPGRLLLWKVERENGRISPFEFPGDLGSDRGRVCWEGGSHHTRYIGLAGVDGDDGADGRYWRDLAGFLPVTWVDEVITCPQLVGRAGKGHGRRRDG